MIHEPPSEAKLHASFVRESNKIEGIYRKPTSEELVEFGRFMGLEKITIDELQAFVSVYEPNARLRYKSHMNVHVGGYRAPLGGAQLVDDLDDIVELANDGYDPYRLHIKYEKLHPFTDCNGRSGRMIWAWQVRDLRLQFLHKWYYQSLQDEFKDQECMDIIRRAAAVLRKNKQAEQSA